MIRIEIKSDDLEYVSAELVGDSSPSVGTSFNLTDDSSLTYLQGLGDHLTANDVITFVLEASKDVSLGIIGGILYDKLKGAQVISLFINGKTVNVAKEAIIEALTEHFRKLPKDGE